MLELLILACVGVNTAAVNSSGWQSCPVQRPAFHSVPLHSLGFHILSTRSSRPLPKPLSRWESYRGVLRASALTACYPQCFEQSEFKGVFSLQRILQAKQKLFRIYTEASVEPHLNLTLGPHTLRRHHRHLAFLFLIFLFLLFILLRARFPGRAFLASRLPSASCVITCDSYFCFSSATFCSDSGFSSARATAHPISLLYSQ